MYVVMLSVEGNFRAQAGNKKGKGIDDIELKKNRREYETEV